MSILEQIDDIILAERIAEAVEVVRDHRTEATFDAGTRAALAVRRSRLAFRSSDDVLDEALLGLERVLADGALPEHELAEAHALRVRAYAVKRCQALADAAADAARSVCGPHPAIVRAEAELALRFDDRPAAAELLEQASTSPEAGDEEQLALANLRYVVAEFAAALEHLARIDRSSPSWGAATRLRAHVHAALDQPADEVAAWAEVVEHRPDSDDRIYDRISLGLALAAADERRRAVDVLREAWRSDPDSGPGRYARERVERLEANPEGSRRRLSAFPSTSQRRNHCGPAVLELCLRYFDMDLDQEQIAPSVMRETGTPMHEIVEYLQRLDVHARRVEATPERIKAAIDIGCPVIVQEEYSTSSHVAVITGYDDGLGVFLASDPATHRPLVKPFGWTHRAGALFGNGGVLVLGPAGPDTEDRALQADKAGLVDEEHLALLDECDRLRPSAAADGNEGPTLHHVIDLAEKALALAPDFKLAWHRRWWSWNQLARITGHDEPRWRAADELMTMQLRYPADEFVHIAHASWLMDQGRFEEAYVAYFEALRSDEGDADSVRGMGLCRWLVGDLAAAERQALGALRMEGDHAAAACDLAGIYVTELLQRRRARVDGNPGPLDDPLGPVRLGVHPDSIRTSVQADEEAGDEDTGDGALERRAAHFAAVARCQRPECSSAQQISGVLCLLQAQPDAAGEYFREALRLEPNGIESMLGLLAAEELADQTEQAWATCKAMVERFSGAAEAWQAAIGFAARVGDTGVACSYARDALDSGGDLRLMTACFYEAHRRAESGEAAATMLTEVVLGRPGDLDLAIEVVDELEWHGHRGHAIEVLHRVLALAPGDFVSTYRLGAMLSEDPMSADEGRALLEAALELAPAHPTILRALAWHHVDGDPEGGIELLRPLLDQEDAYLHETHAALLAAAGRHDEAAAALEYALDVQGRRTSGLLSLAHWHLGANRYDRALELAVMLEAEPASGAEREAVERVWLDAHHNCGRVGEILPRVRERCEQGVPRHLAPSVYWGLRGYDHELAARAALALAESATDADTRLDYRIHAAGELAEAGDHRMLDGMAGECGDRAEAWAFLSYEYSGAERYEEASAAALRGYELDPTVREVLTAVQRAFVRQGKIDEALRCARENLDRHPHEHQGSERLAILLAKLGEVEEAVPHGHRAVALAPYCGVSHAAQALTLFAAGDFDGAARHATRSLAISPEPDDSFADAVLIDRALWGDVAGLERALSKLDGVEPPHVFAGFKAQLRQVAQNRAEQATELA